MVNGLTGERETEKRNSPQVLESVMNIQSVMVNGLTGEEKQKNASRLKC